MNTIIKATDASDFLALVPHLVGFGPRDSIVLVVFRGNRTCGALRLDLPGPSTTSAVRRRIATTMIGMICRIEGADAIVPVVYTDDTFSSGPSMPHRADIRAILARARDSGFRVRDALCVAADAWGSYLDDACPARGHPLERITASPTLGALRDATPQRTLIDVDTESRLPAADSGSRSRTTRKYLALAALRHSPELGPAVFFDHDFSGDIVGFADALLDLGNAPVIPRDAALLAFLAQAPAVRDEILLTWAWGPEFGETVGDMNARHQAGEDISSLPGALALGGFDMPRPDITRLRAAIGVLRYTAPRLPKAARPPLLTMLAWVHWALGSGTIAARWVAHARALDPEYSLAELLDCMLQSGRLPDWAWEVPERTTEEVTIDGER
ncbi:DUF4192 family protein [Mycetocola manganoxydans]|uniref:DUF4192 family protein n=1 Tax=Mycetocola manganoxydans TaxID=699879 RepID=A0A3L7A103_9MICO|nr:DUF4192 family protein [Mycetocola manganoxydans]RLP73754.1 DUF4192 family protein [Mycetocola manganoxydans]GHD43237.1 hypothetical protein GCM10008097_10010 [Mycetocola manganoxydans]